MSSSINKIAFPNNFPEVDNYDTEFFARLKLYALLVEETPDVLIATDVNYKPTTWNKTSEKIFGVKASEVIGKDLSQIITTHYYGSNKEEVRQIIKARGEWHGEAWFVRPTDHKTVTLLMCFKQLKEDNGNILGYLVSATDITNRKEAESRLMESEKRFKDVAESSPAMIWLSDENDITTYANQKWIEFTGKDVGADPDSWISLIHPDDKTRITGEYFKGVEFKKQVTIVYRLRRADGVYRWVHDISVPRFLDNGKFIGYAGSVVDIEDEEQKHEQLRYQSTILENVSDIIVTTDLDYKVKIWNKIAEEYYAVPAEEAVGERIDRLLQFTFYGTTAEASIAELNQNGSWKGEVSIVNRRGEKKHFFHTVKLVYDDAGNKIGYLAVGRDITEKKIADEKLKESELFYRTLIADSLDGMLLLDKDGAINFASPSVKNVLGYNEQEVLGRNGFEFVHPEDISWAYDSFQREIEQNTEVKFVTIRLLKKDGQWLWCNVRGHNLLSNPNVNRIVVYFHDDTLRKEAKDALQESEKKFRSLVKHIRIGVFLSDGSGNIIMCNKALSAMLSIPEEMIVGKNVYDIMSSDMINENNEFIPVSERPLTLTLQLRQTIKDAVLGVLHPITKERSWILVNSDPILDEAGNIKHVVCSVMDLTQRKKLEQKLIADQLSHQRQLTQATIEGQENERKTIGEELHDNIGQQLTTVKLFLDYAKTNAEGETSEMVTMALAGIADVINEVRAMSRSLVPYTLKDLGLVDSINELTESLMRARTLNIKFEHCGSIENSIPENQKLSLFRIVQEQLNNIVKHAAAQNVWIKLCERGSEFVLEIRDDGKGFSNGQTKKGIGILNIKNRAELFNGKAELVSEPGCGCTLIVSFPLHANPAKED
jgi:PAS domain S-box-containing protein